MSGVDLAAGRLDEALRRLHAEWGRAQGFWADAQGQRFGREYLVPLEQQTPQAIKGAQRLARVIAQARKAIK
jgi:hypothetical protein